MVRCKRLGAKRALAAQVGITPVYVSCLLDPYNVRCPSPALAQRLAAALGLPRHQQSSFLEHMHRAQAKRARLRAACHQAPFATWTEILATLDQLLSTVPHTAHEQSIQAVHQAALAFGSIVGGSTYPPQAGLIYAQICLLLRDVAAQVNRPIDALAYAKRAYWASAAYDPASDQHAQQQAELVAVEALRLTANAYKRLGWIKAAFAACEEAYAAPATSQQPNRVQPHLLRDMISIAGMLPRFSLRRIEGWATTARTICEAATEPTTPLLLMMLDNALARTYLHHGKIERAASVLAPHIDHLPTINGAEPLHRVMVLRTAANLAWQQGDHATWATTLRPMLHLAWHTGLAHQFAEVQATYGSALTPLLNDLNIAPDLM